MCISEIDVTISSTEISKTIQTFMWSGRIVGAYRHTWISFGTSCTPLLFRTLHQREAERLFASAGNKGIACAKRIEIPLCHLSCVFSAFPFHSRRANRSNRRALSVCRAVYRIRMYKERKNRELVGGSMRNGRPSLPPANLSRQSRRVTMNGRYYFIGDQAKSKIEKRTGRDERK